MCPVIFIMLLPPGTGGEPEGCPVDSPEDGNPTGSKGEAL